MTQAVVRFRNIEQRAGVVDNGAAVTIAKDQPYTATVRLRGTADLMFHGWNTNAVAAKEAAAKGSEAKKSDDLESYVYRDATQHICLPGTYLVSALCDTARFRKDPRSPRKSARDLVRAGCTVLTAFCPILGAATGKPVMQWDYLDARREVVQRNAITRTRPCFVKGWEVEVELGIILPEYIAPEWLHELLTYAGRINGIAERRPTFGRFALSKFTVAAF